MITKGERSELRTLIRARFKVLRADIAQRETELYAELEDRLNDRCSAEDKGWADVGFLIAEAASEASRKANDIVRQHVGRDLWPKDYELVQPAVLSRIRGMITTSTPDRTQLRRTGHAHIAATIKAAQLELDRQEADLLTKLVTTGLESEDARAFLGQIPTVSSLVPSSRLLELEQSLKEGS